MRKLSKDKKIKKGELYVIPMSNVSYATVDEYTVRRYKNVVSFYYDFFCIDQTLTEEEIEFIKDRYLLLIGINENTVMEAYTKKLLLCLDKDGNYCNDEDFDIDEHAFAIDMHKGVYLYGDEAEVNVQQNILYEEKIKNILNKFYRVEEGKYLHLLDDIHADAIMDNLIYDLRMSADKIKETLE